MFKSGCRYISYDIESGSQRIIDLSGKRIDLKQAEKVIAMTNGIGIAVHINMMYGFPEETKEDLKKQLIL